MFVVLRMSVIDGGVGGVMPAIALARKPTLGPLVGVARGEEGAAGAGLVSEGGAAGAGAAVSDVITPGDFTEGRIEGLGNEAAIAGAPGWAGARGAAEAGAPGVDGAAFRG
jgi:hypothetical protein